LPKQAEIKKKWSILMGNKIFALIKNGVWEQK